MVDYTAASIDNLYTHLENNQLNIRTHFERYFAINEIVYARDLPSALESIEA